MVNREFKVSYNYNTEWWTKGEDEHNPFGPSYVKYYENGLKRMVDFMVDDVYHNLNGPSIIFRSGPHKTVEYHISDVELTYEEWLIERKNYDQDQNNGGTP